MINCYAFGFVPPFARGLVRDLRVRWALEEAGSPESTSFTLTSAGRRSAVRPRSRRCEGGSPSSPPVSTAASIWSDASPPPTS